MGRRARAFTSVIRDWKGGPLTREVSVALAVMKVFLASVEWHPVYSQTVMRRFAMLFSDARRQQRTADSWELECLAAVLLTSAGGCYTVLRVSDGLAQEWLQSASPTHRINECESLAGLMVCTHLRTCSQTQTSSISSITKQRRAPCAKAILEPLRSALSQEPIGRPRIGAER